MQLEEARHASLHACKESLSIRRRCAVRHSGRWAAAVFAQPICALFNAKHMFQVISDSSAHMPAFTRLFQSNVHVWAVEIISIGIVVGLPRACAMEHTMDCERAVLASTVLLPQRYVLGSSSLN